MSIALLTTFFACAFAANCAAATGAAVQRPSATDLAAAVNSAKSAAAIGYAKSNFRQVDHINATKVTVADNGIPAYVLNPDFVLGHGGAPAGTLGYIAVTATAQDGTTATMRAERDGPVGAARLQGAPAHWTVGSVLSGDDERRLTGKLHPGSVLLNEPQINGWYELSAGGVRLLQASLPQSPLGALVPLADYQRQVHDRYADKMPGSAYQRNGGIGFTQQPQQSTGRSIGAGLLAIAVVLGAALLIRRRVRSQAQMMSTPASPGPTSAK